MIEQMKKHLEKWAIAHGWSEAMYHIVAGYIDNCAFRTMEELQAYLDKPIRGQYSGNQWKGGWKYVNEMDLRHAL